MQSNPYDFQKRKKSSFSPLVLDPQMYSSTMMFSSRHSLAVPGAPNLGILEPKSAVIQQARKSSLFNLAGAKESPSFASNLLSVVSIGKLKQKAEHTKEFIKNQANRHNLLELSIHDSEIAKVIHILF